MAVYICICLSKYVYLFVTFSGSLGFTRKGIVHFISLFAFSIENLHLIHQHSMQYAIFLPILLYMTVMHLGFLYFGWLIYPFIIGK